MTNQGIFFRDAAHVWSTTECSKYFFCVEGEVFSFECSTGLTFDINRQICDFKTNVNNCDVTAEETTPKPLLNTEEPICPSGEGACADGTCIPIALFCDGHSGTSIIYRNAMNYRNNTVLFLKIVMIIVTKVGVIPNTIPMLLRFATMPIVLFLIAFVPLMVPLYQEDLIQKTCRS